MKIPPMAQANAPPVVQIDRVRVQPPGQTSFTLLRLQLRDRRQAGRPLFQWVFQRHLEVILYARDDSSGSSGAIYKLLSQTGLGRSSFNVNKAAVTAGLITQAEFDTLLTAFKASLPYADPMTINRTRSFTIVPAATAAAVARNFGRSPAAHSLLQALGAQVPEAWDLQDQRDQNERVGEVDLLLNDEIESAGFEAEERTFASELTTMPTFEAVEEDDGRMTHFILSPVPSVLARELEAFIAYRTSTFMAKRAGGAVMSISAEADKKHILRFMGWLIRTDRVAPAQLQVSLLLGPELASWGQEYATFLRDQQDLRFSSVANYLNGLVSVTSYAYVTLELPEETELLEPSPLTQLINLRAHRLRKRQNKKNSIRSGSAAGLTGSRCSRADRK